MGYNWDLRSGHITNNVMFGVVRKWNKQTQCLYVKGNRMINHQIWWHPLADKHGQDKAGMFPLLAKLYDFARS